MTKKCLINLGGRTLHSRIWKCNYHRFTCTDNDTLYRFWRSITCTCMSKFKSITEDFSTKLNYCITEFDYYYNKCNVGHSASIYLGRISANCFIPLPFSNWKWYNIGSVPPWYYETVNNTEKISLNSWFCVLQQAKICIVHYHLVLHIQIANLQKQLDQQSKAPAGATASTSKPTVTAASVAGWESIPVTTMYMCMYAHIHPAHPIVTHRVSSFCLALCMYSSSCA